MTACPVCTAELSVGLTAWHRACTGCGYEGSILNVHIRDQAMGGDLDEVAREGALATLRNANFKRLLEVIRRLRPNQSTPQNQNTLLDVGCAHGWFLEQAKARYDALGIEPDQNVARATLARGNNVREGYFPNALDKDERYDVICFNDVLEHIPDINATFRACWQHLAPDGLMVINAPNRAGALYNISKQLLKLGQSGTFDRMWQKGFPSPHLHYLDNNALEVLAKRHGFTLIAEERLPSVSATGLYSRVRYSKDVSPIKALMLTVAVTLAIPALAVLPADIKVWFLARKSVE